MSKDTVWKRAEVESPCIQVCVVHPEERICTGCYNLDFNDPLFVDISEDDYRLDTLSVAEGLGVFLPSLPEDILGVMRDTDAPDAGAFERE